MNYKRKPGGGILDTEYSTKPRVDYIDLLKGITILWIIWIHTDHPDFGNYRNPIFFFASGMFFKLTDFKSFFSKRINTIIIPFLFFYILSIPFRFIIDLWDYRSIYAFDWDRILDVFRIIDKSDYLSLNVPLWFLLTLLIIQSMSLLLLRLPNTVIILLACMAVFFKQELEQWPTLFMINNAVYWFAFFAIGFVIGKPLIKLLSLEKRRLQVFTGSILLVFVCVAFEKCGMTDYHEFVEHAKYLAFIVSFTAFMSFFNGMANVEALRFFGKNSLIVLGTHLWILVPLGRIMFKLTGIHHPWIGFGMAIATAILLIPVINILNKKVPYLVGKQNHSPQTTRPSLCRES